MDMRTPTLLLLLLALPAAAGDAPYAADQGPRKVEQVDLFKLKDLQLRLTFPKGRDTCPVIVFSHGLYGTRRAYDPLVKYWASYGYICIQVDHPDSRMFGRKPRAEATKAWNKRPLQIKAILDGLDELTPLKGRGDRTRIGVSGHSFGAHTGQLIAGVKPAIGKSFADERVKAVALLSPQGEGPLFRKDSWKPVARPVLVITGPKDISPFETKKDGTWRRQAYDNLPKGDKYLLYVDNMFHNFGGISGVYLSASGPRNEDFVRITKQTVLAFFDAYVKGDEKAKKWLQSGAPGKAYLIKVRYEKK